VRPYLQNNQSKKVGGVTQVAECLNSNPSILQKKKKRISMKVKTLKNKGDVNEIAMKAIKTQCKFLVSETTQYQLDRLMQEK
jgi:uncharacterized membrane protein